MDIENIKVKILELCSEDVYGSWELWWSIEPKTSENIDSLREQFINAISDLIDEEKIIALSYKREGSKFSNAIFERARLEFEIDHADKPEPNNFYWFDLVNVKRNIGTRYMHPEGQGTVRVLPGNPDATELVKQGNYARISGSSGEQKVSAPVPLAENPALNPQK